jgi:hypothetical protein
MKKIKFILLPLLLLGIVIGCEKDGGESVIDFKLGAVPDIQKVETTDAFINLVAINNEQQVNLGFTVDIARGDVASANIMLFYYKGDNVYKATFATNVTTFPVTYNITQADILSAFTELNDNTDFEVGNALKVTAELTLKNGTIIKILNDDGSANYGADISNSLIFSVLQTYFVSCPSDLAGTYTVLTTAFSTDPGPTPDENPITNFPYTVTITALGGGKYNISDAFGGVYILWYDIYGLDFEVEGQFDDVCGTISGVFPEPFGTDVTYTGSVNPDGTLSIHWVNGYDDEGDSVFTKI